MPALFSDAILKALSKVGSKSLQHVSVYLDDFLINSFLQFFKCTWIMHVHIWLEVILQKDILQNHICLAKQNRRTYQSLLDADFQCLNTSCSETVLSFYLILFICLKEVFYNHRIENIFQLIRPSFYHLYSAMGSIALPRKFWWFLIKAKMKTKVCWSAVITFSMHHINK